MSREAMQMALEALESDPISHAGLVSRKQAITALRQALETEQEPVAWQPIESAPKTGRKVILFYKNRLHVGRTVIARWLTDEQATEIDGDGVGLEGGWYECIDNWDDFTEVAIHEGEPSHWMPFPAPPIEALRQALETEQEPVAWMHNFITNNVITHIPADIVRHPERWTALYKDPTPCKTCESLAMAVMNDQTYHEKVIPKREWVGLTDEELKPLCDENHIMFGAYTVDFIQAIEAKLKEKNT
jgi:hypothetical protein